MQSKCQNKTGREVTGGRGPETLVATVTAAEIGPVPPPPQHIPPPPPLPAESAAAPRRSRSRRGGPDLRGGEVGRRRS